MTGWPISLFDRTLDPSRVPELSNRKQILTFVEDFRKKDNCSTTGSFKKPQMLKLSIGRIASLRKAGWFNGDLHVYSFH